MKERNEVLFSLDEEKIKSYAKKYQVVLPDNELIFWAAIHKTIIDIESAPMELKEKSAIWLIENGYSV